MTRRLLGSIVCVLLLALATVACSSGGGGSSGASSSSESASSDTSTTAAAPAAANDPANIDPSEAGAAYTPTGPLVADSGFRPATDGFSTDNYGGDVNGDPIQDLTPVEVRRMFGDAVCTDPSQNPCDLTPEAQQWMDQNNKDMDGGHCYGFSVASLLFWTKQLHTPDFGAATTPALTIDNNGPLQREIVYAWAMQGLDSVLAATISGTPDDILAKLRDILKPGAPETYSLGITMANGSGGHEVTPYAVEDKGGGNYAVLIYDNNYPDITRAVMIDSNADTWSYDAATNPSEPSELYQGDATTKSMELDPTNPGLAVQPCPFCGKVPSSSSTAAALGRNQVVTASLRTQASSASLDEIYLDGSDTDHGHLLITNPAGQRLGFVDGKVVNEIPGARVDGIFSDEDWKTSIEPNYFVPSGQPYTITVDGRQLKAEDDTEVGVISDSFDLWVSNIALQPGETDTLTYSPDATKASYVASRDQNPTVGVGVSDDVADYEFDLDGVKSPAGQTINVALPAEGADLLVSPSGPPLTDSYGLTMVRSDDKGSQTFKSSFDLSTNDSADLQFGNWDRRTDPIPLVVTHDGQKTTQNLTDTAS